MDERLAFTRDELVAAYELVMPEKRATAEVDALLQEDASTRSYHTNLSEGTLDLLSLVSEDCAERAWRLLGISRDVGERRREAFRQRMTPPAPESTRT